MPARRTIGVAVLLAALSTLVTPFRRDLFVGDETKYGQVVREMRTTSSWFLPTLDGHPQQPGDARVAALPRVETALRKAVG